MENQTPVPSKKKQPRFELRQQTKPGIANTVAFVGVLSVMGLLSLFLTKSTYSESEKRDLAQRPQWTASAYFNGAFASDTDSWFSDTFPGREGLIQLGALMGESRGIRMDDIRLHEVATPSTPEPPTSPELVDPNASGPEENSSSSQPTEDEIAPEKSGSIFIYKGKGLSIFGGSEAMGKWYADTLNKYATTLEGVQIYNLVAPTNIEFALPEKYQSITTPQKPNIDYIYSQLSPQIKGVDAYSKIAQHTDEYIYFNTDHHWTMRGAYHAYTAFCESAGFDPVPLESMDLRSTGNFLGTLYNETQDSKLREAGDYVEYPMFATPHQAFMYMRGEPYTPYASSVMAEYASGVNSYSVFLHGDQPLMEIRTQNPNGRKIVVVKESFGNAFAPFLLNHFETVYVVDQRYFQQPLVSFIQQNGVTDLLFINNIFAANTPYHIQLIGDLMYRQFVPVTPSSSEEEEPPPEEEEVIGEPPTEEIPMVIEPDDYQDNDSDWVDDNDDWVYDD